jgi:hypothetical protein
VSTASAPPPSLRYLAQLTDDHGVFEHAYFVHPRRDGGYCTDDAGRLLALASRLDDDPAAPRLAQVSLSFLELAHDGETHFRLRLRGDRNWTDDDPSDDATGRALLGLGTAAAWAPWPEVRRRALELFSDSCSMRSSHLRAVAYAALGAAQVLRVESAHRGAASLLEHAGELLGNFEEGEAWPWPEPRLSYANALLPEASLAAAQVAGDVARAKSALNQLWWLVQRQTRDGHFSFVPVQGGDEALTLAMFDQQPIEACAMASACAGAYSYTHEPRWASAVERAAAWFLGDNDVGVAMFDAQSGGGYDGLEERGVNRNEGAESSMSFVATMLTLREVRRELAEHSTSSATITS